MAYSAQPQINSEKSVFVPFDKAGFQVPLNQFISPPSTVNLVSQVLEDRKVLVARARLQTETGITTGLTLFGAGLGGIQPSHYWDLDTQRFFYSVWNGVSAYNFYVWTASGGSTFLASFATTPVITPFTNTAGTRFLVVVGTTGGFYNFTTGIWTAITDPDFPADARWPVALDNFVFVVRAGTNDIYQCSFDNPASWVAGDFITADLTPGLPFYMAKIDNYVAIFKSGGVEFFYNAGNPSGSVLAQYESFFKRMTLNISITPREFQNKWFFVGGDTVNKVGLYAVSSTGIELIGDDITSSYLNFTATSIFPARVFFFEMFGRPFVSISNNASVGGTQQVFYDLVNKETLSLRFPGFSTIVDAAYVRNKWFLFDTNLSRSNSNIPLVFTPATTDYDGNAPFLSVTTPLLSFGTDFYKRVKKVEFMVETGNNTPISVSFTGLDQYSNTLFGSRSMAINTASTTNPARRSILCTRMPKTRALKCVFTVTNAQTTFALYGARFDIEIGTD